MKTMKKIKICLLALCAGWCMACTDSDEVSGTLEPLTAEYTLPQGKSDADDRIVQYYEDFGSYILYEYSKSDLAYDLSAYTLTYTEPDLDYMGDMLDLLDEIWFDLYPVEFHKQYMPLKIFIADEIVSNFDGWEYFSIYSRNTVMLGFCSDTLRKLTPTDKINLRNELQRLLWDIWAVTLEFPDEFFELSEYSYPAVEDPESPDYTRARGFVTDYSWGFPDEWSLSGDWMTGMLSETADLSSYLDGMLTRTSAEWAEDLEWPLVKQKYDILRNWVKEKYGFDLQAIGNMTYE